jgi:hypothetical protein
MFFAEDFIFNEIIEKYCFICIKSILQFIVFENTRQEVLPLLHNFCIHTSILATHKPWKHTAVAHKYKIHELVLQKLILNNTEVFKIGINPLLMENGIAYMYSQLGP